jgi:hypothetical protein
MTQSTMVRVRGLVVGGNILVVTFLYEQEPRAAASPQ